MRSVFLFAKKRIREFVGDVSVNHALTGFMAVLMTGIAIAGIMYRLEKKTFLRLGCDAVALLLTFIVNIYLLYLLRGMG